MSSTKSGLHRAFGIDVAAHGDLTGTKRDPNVNLEVIGVGLSRTGTTSLQAALTKLGYTPSHQGVDLFRSVPRTEDFIDLYTKIISGVWKAGDPVLTNRIRELMRGYRSSTDVPVYPLVKEIYPAYPNANYILTVRPGGAEAWFKSVWDAAGWNLRFVLIRDGRGMRQSNQSVEAIGGMRGSASASTLSFFFAGQTTKSK